MIDILKDKVVVVTGGCGLLGEEFVRSVVSHGGVAIIADIDKAMCKLKSKEIAESVGSERVDFYCTDITKLESLDGLFRYVDENYGRIDAVVNNAYPRNQNYGRDFFDVQYEDFCENTSTHLGGYFLTSQQAALYFKEQGYGHIINIASIYGVMAPRFEIYEACDMTMPVEYAAIKSSVIHLTRFMAKRFNNINVRVNAISPGGILNNQPDPFVQSYNSFCLKQGMLQKSDVASVLLFLLSDMSRAITGQNIIVDDGFSL